MKTPINLGIFQSDMDATGYKLVNLPTPTASTDAATKAYVDAHAGGGGSGLPPGTVNVKDDPYNAAGDGTTDDTVAIQSAIDAVFALGGGVVFFPKGIYLCNGAFDATTNSILKLPFVSIAATTPQPVTIELRGETPISIRADGGNASIIKSTKTGTGTGPAILAANSYKGRSYITDFLHDFSYMQAVLRNLQFETGDNPTIDGVRLEAITFAILEDVVITTALPLSQPTHGTVGLWMPSTQNFATNHCNRVFIQGFATGMVAGAEHFRAPQLNFIHCLVACEFLSGGELGWANLMVFLCKTAVKFTVLDASIPKCPVLLNLNIEATASGWEARDVDILDASNCGTGEIRYWVWNSITSVPLTLTGGANLRLVDTGTAGTIHYIGTDARLTAISGGVKLEVRNTGTGVWIEATRYTNP